MSSPASGRPGDDEQIVVPKHNVLAAQALEVVSRVLETSDGRSRFRENPREAFDDGRGRLEEISLQRAEYDDIPARSREALESLSVEQLEALAMLNQTFVDDGLYVEVPSPGKLFYH
jgi:hypothetical protein